MSQISSHKGVALKEFVCFHTSSIATSTSGSISCPSLPTLILLIH